MAVNSLIGHGSDETTVGCQHRTTGRSLLPGRRVHRFEETPGDTSHTDESLSLLPSWVLVLRTVLDPMSCRSQPRVTARDRQLTHPSDHTYSRCTRLGALCPRAYCNRTSDWDRLLTLLALGAA